MIIAPAHRYYACAGHEEYCLSFGDPDAVRRILIVPPLFDEMSRMRSMLVTAMRALATRGVGTCLPDLPGCNESFADMGAQTLDSWRVAVCCAAKAFNSTHIASIRGGALLDDTIDLPHWRLAPATGSSIVKTMLRTRIAADRERGSNSTSESLRAAALSGPIECSGYMLGAAMLASLDLAAARPVPQLRELALGVGPDAIAGSTLWLRAEPHSDPLMSAAIADDLDRWSAACGK